jgi:hypothetical protein
MAKPKSNPDAPYVAKLAHYDRLVATFPGVERKGDANPYTALNGNMSSYLHPRGQLALRLPPEARAAFLESYGATLFEAYGIVQKEYVTVPDDLLADTSGLAPHFQASLDWVRAMKPKPSKAKGK